MLFFSLAGISSHVALGGKFLKRADSDSYKFPLSQRTAFLGEQFVRKSPRSMLLVRFALACFILIDELAEPAHAQSQLDFYSPSTPSRPISSASEGAFCWSDSAASFFPCLKASTHFQSRVQSVLKFSCSLATHAAGFKTPISPKALCATTHTTPIVQRLYVDVSCAMIRVTASAWIDRRVDLRVPRACILDRYLMMDVEVTDYPPSRIT